MATASFSSPYCGKMTAPLTIKKFIYDAMLTSPSSRGMVPSTASMVSAPSSKHGFFVRQSLWTFNLRPLASVASLRNLYAACACS